MQPPFKEGRAGCPLIARLMVAVVVADVILSGFVIYEFNTYGGTLLGPRTLTVTVTSTVSPIEAPRAKINVTSVNCSVLNRSCTVSILNYGDTVATLLACTFQQSGGGVVALNGTGGLQPHSQTTVSCKAPTGMAGVEAGSRVIGALFFVQSSPLPWLGAWR